MVTLIPGIPWLCAVFVASLYFGRRPVTVVAVLVASLGWTLVRTEGVTGSMDADFAWRWSATAEERFLASDASAVPAPPAVPSVVEAAAWPGLRGPARDNVVVCYEATTGEPIWVYAYPARFWEAMGGAGPRATPTYHDGRLYTLGATGVLNCLDAATGELVWTRNMAEDAGARVPDWGFASSPLVVDGLVIVHAAGAPEGRAVVAYDLATGEPRWFGQASGAGYSSPHLTVIDDVPQIVMLTGDGAFGLEPATGDLLWKHDWPMGGTGSRVLQPAILDGGGAILIGTSFGFGTRRIAVSSDGSAGWTVDEGWTSQGLKPYFNDLVVHRGFALGIDWNIFAALDVETGGRAWKGGRYGNGQILLLPSQDLLLVLSERGELALVRASAERFEELARTPALNGKTWNHPIVVDGVVYLRNGTEAAAFRL